VTLDVPKELKQQMNPRKLNLEKLEMHEEVKVARFYLSPPIESIFMDCQTFQKHFKHFNTSLQLMKVTLWNNEQEGKLSPLRVEPCSFLSLKGSVTN
jgi:hypothetical protein